MGFAAGFHRGEVPALVCYVRGCMIPTWLITGEVNLDHLVSPLFITFLKSKLRNSKYFKVS